MPLEINASAVVRRDRENMYLVAVLDPEFFKRCAQRILVAALSYIQAQHRSLFMRFHSLYFNVPQRCRWQDSSRSVQHIVQILFSMQFVYRWPPYHSLDRDGRPQRRHAQRIAILKALQISPNSMQQKIVGIYFFKQRLPPLTLDASQRSARSPSARRKQRIQRCRKRTNVVSPRRSDFS